MADNKKPSRLLSLKAEFMKIFWPNRESVAKQTVAVVLVSTIMGILIVFFDMVLQFGLDRLFQI